MADPTDISGLRASLTAGGELRFTPDGKLTLSARPRLAFTLNWLREVAPGQILGALGRLVDTTAEVTVDLALEGGFECVLSPEEQGWTRLQLFKRADARFGLASRVAVTLEGQAPMEEIARRLAAAITRIDEPDCAGGLKAEALKLADTVCRYVVGALEKKYSAEASFRYERASAETALLDCSFAPGAAGEAALGKALAADFSWLAQETGEHVRIRQAVFTDELRRESRVELDLPFLTRQQWSARWAVLAKVEVQTGEDGRLTVCTVEAADQLQKNSYQSTLALSGGLVLRARGEPQGSFTLTYTDRRTMSVEQASFSLAAVLRGYGFDGQWEAWLKERRDAAAQGVAAALTLTAPGELVDAWLRAPGESGPDFFPTYAAVSVAVQRAVRRWLPYFYFRDPGRYENLGAAWPLVVYQATPPFRGKPRCEFTYDVMDCGSTRLLRRSTLRGLTATLERIRPLLIAAGRNKAARFYSPDEAPAILAAVTRQPRLLNALLAADTFLVDALICLGLQGHAFREASTRDPAKAAKALARFAGDFVATFHRRLRRLYAGEDFLSLGTLLLIEATRALNSALQLAAPVNAILRLTLGPEGSADGPEQTFVSTAYRA